MYIGRDPYGWTNGNWNALGNTPVPGAITAVRGFNLNCGIHLPHDLFPGDVIKFCGSSYLYSGLGSFYPPDLSVTLVQTECASLCSITFKTLPVSPVISTQNFSYICNDRNDYYLCFSIEHTVTQTYKACSTIFFAGFGWDMTPFGDGTVSPRVTFTLNTERNCTEVDTTPNMELQLCCDPSVVEVVFNTALTVGDFFVDNEGNCWEAQAKTAAAVTSSRTVTTSYTSCLSCVTANPCPANLLVISCCEGGPETFTGSLPTISLGDTFVDTYGFCWRAVQETTSPTTGTVYVDTNLGAVECLTCTDDNPCPQIIELSPCCKKIVYYPILTTPALLGYTPSDGEIIVDTFGICYIVNLGTTGNVSAPFITYSDTYGVGDFCETCTTDNECLDVYHTVINCCTGDTEVVLLGAIASPDTVIRFSLTTSPAVDQCWKVVSYSNTGTATITVDNFPGAYDDCQKCIEDLKEGCPAYYKMEDCCGVLTSETMLLPISNVSQLSMIFTDTANNCWYIAGAGGSGPDTIAWGGNAYNTCAACNSNYENCTLVLLKSCCFEMQGFTSLESLGGGVAVGDTFIDQFGLCWYIYDVAPTDYPHGSLEFINVALIYSTGADECTDCKIDNPCPAGLYYQVQNCCTGETRTVYDSAGLIIGLTYSWFTSLDEYAPDCWKVISFTLTGTANMTVSIGAGGYDRCIDCIKANQGNYGVRCHSYYIAVSCCGLPDEVVYLPEYIHNAGGAFADTSNNCYSTLAPTVGPATITWNGDDYVGSLNACDDCITDYPCAARAPIKK
jgi:hypothetical protein